MSIKKKLVAIRDRYVIHQAQSAKLPNFSSKSICRYRVIFSGRVQKVGFRAEVCELAKRMNLTGFCQNLENGDVFAELQGPEDKIQFLIQFMESLKRIKIRKKTVEIIDLVENETQFKSC